jgi:hypothetical protein
LVGLLLIPAVVAMADEDALSIIFQSLSLTYNYPWRIILYGFTIGIIEIFSILIFKRRINENLLEREDEELMDYHLK